MSDNLNKFFQDKFKDREVPFQNEYWKDMEALLEEDKKDDRKIIFGWWKGLGIGLLIGVLLATIYFYTINNKALLKVKENIDKPIATVEDSNLEKINKTNISDTKNTVTFSIQKEGQKESNTKATRHPNSSQTFSTNKINQANALQKSTEVIENNIVQTTKHIETASNNEANAPFINQIIDAVSEKATTLLEKQNSQRKKEVIQKQKYIFAPIHTKKYALSSLDRALPTYFEWSSPPMTRPIIKQKLTFSGILGASFYPINDAEQTNGRGIFSGLSFQYKLKPKWYLNADVLYQFQKDALASNKEARVLEYGFGYKASDYNTNYKQAHVLSMPIYLQYQPSNLSIEAGLSLNRLLALRATYQKTVTTNFARVEPFSIEERSYWAADQHINKWTSDVFLGLGWQLSKKTMIGFRGQYRMSNFVTSANVELSNPSSKLSKWYIGAYVKYNFKKL